MEKAELLQKQRRAQEMIIDLAEIISDIEGPYWALSIKQGTEPTLLLRVERTTKIPRKAAHGGINV